MKKEEMVKGERKTIDKQTDPFFQGKESLVQEEKGKVPESSIPTEGEDAETLPDFDLKSFIPSSSSSKTRIGSNRGGIISVIKSKQHGKRISLSKELMSELGDPKQLQFSFNDHVIAVSEDLMTDSHSFPVKKADAKGVIYSTDLVKEIEKKFNLNFQDKVSITFYEVTYQQVNKKKVAFIKVENQ